MNVSPAMMKHDALGESNVKGAACRIALTPDQAQNRGLIWVIGAFLICPCHLPITLGLGAMLLAGTAAGAALQGHPVIAGTIISLAWVAATWRGFRLLRISSSRPSITITERQK